MTKVMFICHGNICRSPMAEFVFRDIVRKAGLGNEFHIESAATSTEEIGNGIHYGTRAKLKEKNIPFDSHYAVQIKKSDYSKYDYLVCMDNMNLRNMKKILGNDNEHKMYRLLDFTDSPRDVADPWYTGNFDVTYDDIQKGCQALLRHILENKK